MLLPFRFLPLHLVSVTSASVQGLLPPRSRLEPWSWFLRPPYSPHSAALSLGAVNAWILFHPNTTCGVLCPSQGQRWLTLPWHSCVAPEVASV